MRPRGLLTGLLAMCVGVVNAQAPTELPSIPLYSVQTGFAPALIVESGDLGCALIVEENNANLNGPEPWGYEYTNPLYKVTDEWGQGCEYDLIAHGGIGGYPDGYTIHNWFAQNWVLQNNACPAGYTGAVSHDTNGQPLLGCIPNAIVETKPQKCPVNVGNPISCNTGKKIEHVVDASFGSATIERTFRSGILWADSEPLSIAVHILLDIFMAKLLVACFKLRLNPYLTR